MRQKSLAALLTALTVSAAIVHGQAQKVEQATNTVIKPITHVPYFIDPTLLDLSLTLPPPPAQTSETTKAELAEIHHIETQRTPRQVAAAQADDKEQDIFIFRDVLGTGFTAENLPLTASLSAHIHNDEGVASKPLKSGFARPRPYQFDNSLHPVCELSKEPNSYPSGHTLGGYLFAFTLIEMLPKKKAEIIARADDYAQNRVVCGVHYPSDVEASKRLAYVMFGYMLANPRFQKELASAREEISRRYEMPSATAR